MIRKTSNKSQNLCKIFNSVKNKISIIIYFLTLRTFFFEIEQKSSDLSGYWRFYTLEGHLALFTLRTSFWRDFHLLAKSEQRCWILHITDDLLKAQLFAENLAHSVIRLWPVNDVSGNKNSFLETSGRKEYFDFIIYIIEIFNLESSLLNIYTLKYWQT